MTLFPRIRRRFPGLPLLAAGGIVDGATMAAALVLGADADAVWCGSRFLASQEAKAHDAYKDRVLSADVDDTAVLSIYGPEWPGQAMRTIVNDGAQVALGPEPEATEDAVGQIIGSTVRNGPTIPVPRYSAILPTRDFEGDIESGMPDCRIERRQHRRDSTSRGDRPTHDERGEGGTRWPCCYEGGRLMRGRVANGRRRHLPCCSESDQSTAPLQHVVLLQAAQDRWGP